MQQDPFGYATPQSLDEDLERALRRVLRDRLSATEDSSEPDLDALGEYQNRRAA